MNAARGRPVSRETIAEEWAVELFAEARELALRSLQKHRDAKALLALVRTGGAEERTG